MAEPVIVGGEMRRDTIREELSVYLRERFRPLPEGSERAEPDVYIGSLSEFRQKPDLSSKQAADLSELLGELGSSFHEQLFSLINSSGMTDTEVYRRAGLDRKLFSKIRSNPAYHPRKQTVLAICVALKLNIEAAEDLMSRAGYAFSPGSKGDLIVKFFIEHKVYDIDAVNFMLEEYGESALS